MVGWAVLVGVDYYPDGKAQLRGCVQDVEDLYELLCDTYCFHSSRIFKLISVRPAATLALGTNPSATPTYHNIIRTIQDIEDNAQAGDHIYIHFSCRTGRAPSIIPSDRRCYDTKELVLLPADHEATKKFLHELELAVLLRSLTSKGLEVTLIIDGRFSLDSETPVAASTFSEEDLLSACYNTYSDGRLLYGVSATGRTEIGVRSWLDSPDAAAPYTGVISVGLLDQSIRNEYLDEASGIWNGFVTAWLCRTIREYGPFIPFGDLYQRLVLEAKGLSAERQFTTIDQARRLFLMGDPNRAFVGGQRARKARPRVFTAFFLEGKDQLELAIKGGTVHGIRPDELFAVVSEVQEAESGPRLRAQYRGVVQVVELSGLRAMAKPLNGPVSIGAIPQALKVIPLRDSAMLNANSKPTTPLGNITAGGDILKQLQQCVEPVVEIDPISPKLQSNLYHELLGGGHMSGISGIIDARLIGGYRYDITTSPIYPMLDRNGTLHLLSGDLATLYIRNLTEKDLFVYVLCFDSAYGLTQIYPTIDDGNYSLSDSKHRIMEGPVTPAKDLCLHLKVSVPNVHATNTGGGAHSEVLRVVATQTRTSFEAIQVPAMSDTWKDASHASVRIATAYSGEGERAVDPLREKLAPSRGWAVRDIGNWSCVNVGIIVHETLDSLRGVIEGHS